MPSASRPRSPPVSTPPTVAVITRKRAEPLVGVADQLPVAVMVFWAVALCEQVVSVQPPVPPTGNDIPSAATGAEPPDPQWRALGRDDLFKLAVKRGLDPHHHLGKEKLLKMLGL